MDIEFSELSANRIYHTMTQALVPRPVAWVLSENDGGNFNLAPFSYFNAVSSDPPLIMLSIGKKPGGELKDTRANIMARKHCVVHIAHREMVEQVTQSSASFDAGISEVEELGLSLLPFAGSALPRLADCRLAMACELYRIEDITDSQALLLAQVKSIYVDDKAIIKDEKGRIKIQAQAIDPISRLGGSEYGLLGDVVSIARPE